MNKELWIAAAVAVAAGFYWAGQANLPTGAQDAYNLGFNLASGNGFSIA